MTADSDDSGATTKRPCEHVFVYLRTYEDTSYQWMDLFFCQRCLAQQAVKRTHG